MRRYTRIIAAATSKKEDVARDTAHSCGDTAGLSWLKAPPTRSRHVRNAISIAGGAHKANILFKTFKVDDKHAEVTYDDGAAEAQASLVKTDAGWRIAWVQPLNVYF